jgi:hypothetical protein
LRHARVAQQALASTADQLQVQDVPSHAQKLLGYAQVTCVVQTPPVLGWLVGQAFGLHCQAVPHVHTTSPYEQSPEPWTQGAPSAGRAVGQLHGKARKFGPQMQFWS